MVLYGGTGTLGKLGLAQGSGPFLFPSFLPLSLPSHPPTQDMVITTSVLQRAGKPSSRNTGLPVFHHIDRNRMPSSSLHMAPAFSRIKDLFIYLFFANMLAYLENFNNCFVCAIGRGTYMEVRGQLSRVSSSITWAWVTESSAQTWW